MSRKPDSFMPLWIADYLADTAHLTLLQSGAYLHLLMHYWRTGGPLAANDDALAAICKTPLAEWRRTIKPAVEPFFTTVDGRWHQKRAEEELKRAVAYVERKSLAGRVGAQHRWHNDASANGTAYSKRMATALANGTANACQPDAISPSPTHEELLPDYPKPDNQEESAGEQETKRISSEEIEEFFNKYNDLAEKVGLRELRVRSPERRKRAAKFLKDYGMFGWIGHLRNIETQPFLHGVNQRGWKADFDFVTRPSAMTKIEEQYYLQEGNGHDR